MYLKITKSSGHCAVELLQSKCCLLFVCTRLGMYRDAERQFKAALTQQDMVDTVLYLCKVYVRLDQPLTAIDLYKKGLEKFPSETTLLTGIARIYEVSLPSGCSFKVNKCFRPLSHDIKTSGCLAAFKASLKSYFNSLFSQHSYIFALH